MFFPCLNMRVPSGFIGCNTPANYGGVSSFMCSTTSAVIWRFIHVDEEGVEPKRKQQQMQRQQQETETTERSNNSEYLEKKTTVAKNSKCATSNRTLDVKGAITLAVAITSFLLVITYLEIGTGAGTSSSSTIPIASFLIAGIISLALFILVEKRSASPLFDFGLLLNRRSSTSWIWRRSYQCIKYTATIRFCISGIRTRLRSNNIQVRFYETNHSWHSSEHHWILWSCDIPFNRILIIVKSCNYFYRPIIV